MTFRQFITDKPNKILTIQLGGLVYLRKLYIIIINFFNHDKIINPQ